MVTTAVGVKDELLIHRLYRILHFQRILAYMKLASCINSMRKAVQVVILLIRKLKVQIIEVTLKSDEARK